MVAPKAKGVGWKYFINKGNKCRINGLLAQQLDKAYKQMLKDDDFLILIVGPEGVGKSKLRDLIGGYWQHITGKEFTVRNIHFVATDYMSVALKDEPYTFHTHDETRRDLNSKRSMSKIAVGFTNYLSECRDNNQAHALILPAFCDIDKYVALWRAKLLIEVGRWKNKQTGEYQRGLFRVIKTRNRKKLEHYHKNKYSKFPRSMVAFSGFFEDNEIIPKDSYRRKKQEHKELKYADDQNKIKGHVLTPRQIEVLGKLQPGKIFKDNPADYECMRKLVYSLRKSGPGQSG